LGILIGSGAIILSRQQMGQKMPFAPFLALGAVITVFSGDTIWSHYMRLFLPGY
jgi:leader peptidase (prepilin peptidase)/N-methyltransferase